MSKKITALIPGAALALGIACIAKWLETLESSAGLHLIGASVIALFIGMAGHQCVFPAQQNNRAGHQIHL